MKKLIIILLLIPALTFGQNMRTIKVKANHHYANRIFWPDRGLRIEANIILDENCWYERNGKYNWLNKLFGYHDLFRSIHKNSARFVYLPSVFKDSCDIYFYVYENGVSPQQNPKLKGFIKRIRTVDNHNYLILDYLDRYEFYIDRELLKSLETYQRKPYFLDLYWIDILYSGGSGTLPFEISAQYQIIY